MCEHLAHTQQQQQPRGMSCRLRAEALSGGAGAALCEPFLAIFFDGGGEDTCPLWAASPYIAPTGGRACAATQRGRPEPSSSPPLSVASGPLLHASWDVLFHRTEPALSPAPTTAGSSIHQARAPTQLFWSPCQGASITGDELLEGQGDFLFLLLNCRKN